MSFVPHFLVGSLRLRLPNNSETVTQVTSIMGSSALGLQHRLQTPYPLFPLSALFAHSDEWQHSVIMVQLELRADPKELLWIGKSPLFS